MYKCNKCKNDLEHINYEFWICQNCLMIVVIMVTKNWDNNTYNPDNRFHLWKKGNDIIKHEIPNEPEIIHNYLELVNNGLGV